MKNITYTLEEYAKVSREMVSEGVVLLKNDNQALPLVKGQKVAIFGINAFYYYKSGLGSGGLVNARYVISVLDALREEKDIVLDDSVLAIYEEWIKENPFDLGKGWGKVPWSQKEMPLDDEIVKKAGQENDIAVVFIGRTAGEDQDNTPDAGSYLLTDNEKDMLDKVCRNFDKTVVLLNTGNIIDMKFVEEYNPSAVMYIWQGGQEGGHGVADVIMGRVNPSGHLADTIAKDITDYPSTENFGDMDRNFYKEDIFVGYRYFETFAKDKVLYPFGYGLSYTDFSIKAGIMQQEKSAINVVAEVTNTGNVAGKEVVQVYVKAPRGRLTKPEKVFVGFAKTKLLQPGEKETVEIICPKSYFASYDEAGETGFKSCYVLEEGSYEIYCGNDVRSAKLCGTYFQTEEVVEKLKEECAPTESFEIMHTGDGIKTAHKRTKSIDDKLEMDYIEAIPYTGDKGIKFKDVYDGKYTIDEFIGQLSDWDMSCIARGEGICSIKGVPGTVGAFGGMTESLKKYGIPVASVADGPSGIRLDCGYNAFSNPNGAVIACSFNTELTEKLFVYQGSELYYNGIDMLLGPGINIHRNPLNGRNFEYFSEDPILTGKMCVAQLKGLKRAGVDGTIKHFATNNQEKNRNYVESVLSERTLREIYLKPFEIAVKEGDAKSIMTSYNPYNGIWTSSNYEMLTRILRREWKFDGIVMSDWWAMGNWEGGAPSVQTRAPMVRAQNDLFMLCDDNEIEEDDILPSLEKGLITRGMLQRNTRNILKFLLGSITMQFAIGKLDRKKLLAKNDDMQEFVIPENIREYSLIDGEALIKCDDEFVDQEYGRFFDINIDETAEYKMYVKAASELIEIAQIPVSLFVDREYHSTLSVRGTNGKLIEKELKLYELPKGKHHMKLVYHKYALEISDIRIVKA